MSFATIGAAGGADIFNSAAGTLAVSAAAAQTAVLPEGLYHVWCTVECFIKVAVTANDLTAANGYIVRTSTTVAVPVRSGMRIGAIAGGAGTLSYHKVG
jgi:hypothetical protein